MLTAGMRPVKREKLTTQVIERLKTYIADNDLRPGDRLPSEREMVSELGISRNILREAICSMEAMGLIETETGEGTFVSDFDCSRLADHIAFAILRDSQQRRYVEDARTALAMCASERAHNPILERLDSALAKLAGGTRELDETSNDS